MHRIAVFPGDGIGPEVVREGLKVLRTVSEVAGFKYELEEFPHSSEHYLATDVLLPPDLLQRLRDFSAIYLGAIGDPRLPVGLVERGIILGMRFGLDLYINLRPVKLYSEKFCPLKNKKAEDVDMVIIRENTEGAYSQVGGILRKGTPEEVSVTNMINTRAGVERAIRYAFELCRKQKRGKVTLVDKANAIQAHDLWTRAFAEVGEEYPEIEKDHAYVDAACMWMIKSPEWFEVIVTPNLFGDIITDIGAMIQGGMGVAASANIHPGRVSMFEPIHGSAPKYKGKNVANPIAAIVAIQMMLDYLGEDEAAALIDAALNRLFQTDRIRSLSAGAHKTDEIGAMVVDEVRKSADSVA
ncbi:MAG: 3-isopropylmalate dehydrogenase [Planctomycetota bacterium]|nr:3-isopropylmalate dehydrogenase [Planctomycetota bacterium]